MWRVFAALIDANSAGIPVPQSTDSTKLPSDVLYPVYFWAGVIAVIIIVIAGFYYTTSNGNPQQVTRSKNAILGAVIGLAVILMAFALTAAIIRIAK